MNAVVFGAEVLDGCNSTSSKIHLAFLQFHSKSEAMTTEVQHLLKMKKILRFHIWLCIIVRHKTLDISQTEQALLLL